MAFATPQKFYFLDTETQVKWSIDGITDIERIANQQVHEGRTHRDVFSPEGYSNDSASTPDDGATTESGGLAAYPAEKARVSDDLMHVAPRATPLAVTVLEFTLGGDLSGAGAKVRYYEHRTRFSNVSYPELA